MGRGVWKHGKVKGKSSRAESRAVRGKLGKGRKSGGLSNTADFSALVRLLRLMPEIPHIKKGYSKSLMQWVRNARHSNPSDPALSNPSDKHNPDLPPTPPPPF